MVLGRHPLFPMLIPDRFRFYRLMISGWADVPTPCFRAADSTEGDGAVLGESLGVL